MWVIAAAGVVGLSMWLFVSALLADGRWAVLARSYRRGSELPAIRLRYRTVHLAPGWPRARYGIVALGASETGLFLSLEMYDPFHPPLFIPWAAIRTIHGQTPFARWTGIECAGVCGVTVWVTEADYMELLDAVERTGS